MSLKCVLDEWDHIVLSSVEVNQEVKHIIFEEDRKVNMISVIYEDLRCSKGQLEGQANIWNMQKAPALTTQAVRSTRLS